MVHGRGCVWGGAYGTVSRAGGGGEGRASQCADATGRDGKCEGARGRGSEGMRGEVDEGTRGQGDKGTKGR